MEKNTDDLECNFCRSKIDLILIPESEDFYYCRTCMEKFELQEEMVGKDLEPQPYLE